jgi:hypothetical protein
MNPLLIDKKWVVIKSLNDKPTGVGFPSKKKAVDCMRRFQRVLSYKNQIYVRDVNDFKSVSFISEEEFARHYLLLMVSYHSKT